MSCIIRRITVTGKIFILFGTYENCAVSLGVSSHRATLQDPYGLWLDSVANLYFTDANSIHRSFVVSSPTSQPSRLPSSQPTAQPTHQPSSQPTGAPSVPTSQPSSSPTYPVVDYYPNLFMKLLGGFSSAGDSGDNGLATLAAFNNPGFPWVGPSGNVYIPDTSNQRIRRIDTNRIVATFGGTGGTVTGTSGPISSTALGTVRCVVGNSDGSVLYISAQHFIWKYEFTTDFVSVIAGFISIGSSGDSGPAIAAKLNGPQGLWLTTSGNLFIADTNNRKIRKIASAGIITTVAGSGASAGFAGDGGPANTARLNSPTSVYMDTVGKLFIADQSNNRIRVVGINNIITTFAGTGLTSPYHGDNIPATMANINFPRDVKGDSLGNIYISDAGSCVIRKVTATGFITTLFGSVGQCGYSSGVSPHSTSLLQQPQGIWLNSAANLYFTDLTSVHKGVTFSSPSSQPSRQPTCQPTRQPTYRPTTPTSQPSSSPSYHVIDNDPNLFMELVGGSVVSGFSGDNGPSTSALFSTPGIPWVDSVGSIYIPDIGNARIRKIQNGIITTFGGTGGSVANGVSGSIESTDLGLVRCIVGNVPGTELYISSGNYIWKYVFSSNIVSVIAGTGTPGFSGDNGAATAAQVNSPVGLWFTTSGIYFVDRGNHRIRKINNSGIITTVAGSSGSAGFSGDGGPATSATLKFPWGIFVDTMGKLFIADRENNRIRVVDANNIITTFAGTGVEAPFNGEHIRAAASNFNLSEDVKGDSLGNIYIADFNNCIVRKVTASSGNISTLFGIPGKCSLSTGISPHRSNILRPIGLWLDSASNVYVTSLNAVHRSFLVSSPTSQPTGQPSRLPSLQPTAFPSGLPTEQPNVLPTGQPMGYPSSHPTSYPTTLPSNEPSCQPAGRPSDYPTRQPSSQPTSEPTNQPSSRPSQGPTVLPSSLPTKQPSSEPTSLPTSDPSTQPVTQSTPQPTHYPSSVPSSVPTSQPSSLPSLLPSSQPSNRPTKGPTIQPISKPTRRPTGQPSNYPITLPSVCPSSQPIALPTDQPMNRPTTLPIGYPTEQPTNFPTTNPSSVPTRQPTVLPIGQPTSQPTRKPTNQPSHRQSSDFSSELSVQPSGRPSSQPSEKPISVPSSFPSAQPSVQPTARPFSLPTSSPVASTYQTKGVIFFPGSPLYSIEINTKKEELLGLSYILFGRNLRGKDGGFPNVVTLGETASTKIFVSLLNDDISGISRDSTTQSSTVLGDVNNDGHLDILIGLPLDSKCLIYLGSSVGFDEEESFKVVGDLEQGGGQLGWASTRVGDLNHDGFDEIIVSAPYGNTVYFIYGRPDLHEDIVLANLKPSDGFKITGSLQDMNFGVALAAVHDFNKDGLQDIAITAVRAGGANVIYVILGVVSLGNVDIDIGIDQLLETNPTTCFRIFAPYLSNAGFSISGVGDINNDGYNDLAIGSIPIRNARYVEQKTYIVFGRGLITQNDLFLSEMSVNDGFTVSGAGFLVQGAGDVNNDGIPDVMLTSYYDWKGKGNTYLIKYPLNVTYSPTVQPSSSPSGLPSSMPSAVPSSSVPSLVPTATQTTFYPTSANTLATLNPQRALTRSPTVKASVKPSRLPSFRPSRSSSPCLKPTLLPTYEPTPVPSSIRISPSAQPVSRMPTYPHFLRSRIPTTISSTEITLNTTDFTEVVCNQHGTYIGRNKTNYKFIISANTGTVTITGVEYGGTKNLYILSSEGVNVVITNFRLSTDILSVAHLQDSGYSYPTLSEISYFARNRAGNPLTLLFCAEDKLQVILSSHTTFDLSGGNFLFIPPVGENVGKVKNSILVQVEIGIVFAIIGITFLIFQVFSYQSRKEEKEQMKREQELVRLSVSTTTKLKDDAEVEEGLQDHGNAEHPSSALSSSLCFTSSEESYGEIKDGSETIGDGILSSIGSSDWLDALVLSDNEDPAKQEDIGSLVSESDEITLPGILDIPNINAIYFQYAMGDNDSFDELRLHSLNSDNSVFRE
jgi:hypothetical protein